MRTTMKAADIDPMDALNRAHIPQDHNKVCGNCGLPVYQVIGKIWRHKAKTKGEQTCGRPPFPVDQLPKWKLPS